MSAIDKQTQIMIQEQEPLTGFLSEISSDHAYIHKGIAFTAIINTGSIDAAYDIAFTTPAEGTGKYIHWRPTGITTSADYIQVDLRQGDTFSSGSAVTPFNRNCNSLNTSLITTMVKGATATPAGTLKQSFGVGTSGNAASRAGGGAGANEELVLLPGTNYVLTVTPDSATTCIATLFWYEEDRGL